MRNPPEKIIIQDEAVELVAELARLSSGYEIFDLARAMQWDIDDFRRRCDALCKQVDHQIYGI